MIAVLLRGPGVLRFGQPNAAHAREVASEYGAERRAVTMRRFLQRAEEIVLGHRDRVLATLAMALNNLGIRYSEVGRRQCAEIYLSRRGPCRPSLVRGEREARLRA